MTEPRQRKPRFRRIKPTTPLRLTERDFAILNHVSIHRFLRSDHLASLLAGSSQHIVRRLGRLYHAGYLARPHHQRRLPKISGPLVYTLTEKGRKALKERGSDVHSGVPRLRKLGSSLRLGHDLLVSDVLVALEKDCQQAGFDFAFPHQWPGAAERAKPTTLVELKWPIRSQSGRRQWVIPDAAFSIQASERSPTWFLLEVDRGTMPVTRSDPAQSSFVGKVDAYRETRKAGHLWKRWQIPGFRVLVVTESAARMKSLQSGTAARFRGGRSTMFLFTTVDELTRSSDPLGSHWQDCSGEPASLFHQPPTDR